VTDRVVQAVLKLVLEPIFEADFKPCSYGFRPRRRAQDAVAEIQHMTTRGYEWVLEADIEACFDRIDHAALLERVRRRISDKRVLVLVKAFLKAGIMTTSGGREETLTGTPQGGILSPLLANIAVRTRKSCERAWQVAGVAGSRADAGDCPGGQPGCWGGVAQAWRSSGLAVQGRNRSSAGPVGGFPALRPHWSR
jgi:RNA-directed DNA polymerase